MWGWVVWVALAQATGPSEPEHVSSKAVCLTLRDGQQVHGALSPVQPGGSFELELPGGGHLSIPNADVAAVVEEGASSSRWTRDRNRTHYFLGTMLERNEVFLSQQELVLAPG
jgi:hypothetical protein